MNPVPPRMRMRSGFGAVGIALAWSELADNRPMPSAPPSTAEAFRKSRRLPDTDEPCQNGCERSNRPRGSIGNIRPVLRHRRFLSPLDTAPALAARSEVESPPQGRVRGGSRGVAEPRRGGGGP